MQYDYIAVRQTQVPCPARPLFQHLRDAVTRETWDSTELIRPAEAAGGK